MHRPEEETEIERLRAKIETQEAKLSALSNAVAALIAAQVTSREDFRVAQYLKDSMTHDFSTSQNGGTPRFKPAYFEGRGECYHDILETLGASSLLSEYTKVSSLQFRRNKEDRRMERIRETLDRIEYAGQN